MTINSSLDKSKRNLGEDIADALEDAIINDKEGKLVRLPTEADLCQEFNVSRTAIREAMRILRERGLIKTRVGDGAYVTKPDSYDMQRMLFRMIKLNSMTDADVTRVRLLLECEAARLAAENKDEAFIERLEANVDKMRTVMGSLSERVNVDIEFHLLIAQQSKNPLLYVFISSINEILKEYIETRIATRPEGNMDGILWHTRIIEAFRLGTPEDVEKSVRQHLLNSFNQISKD